MSADQFFYMLFSTYTRREIFGQITFYYCDVCLYSLIFGLTLFIVPDFSVNGCMFHRDLLLLMAILTVHTVYLLTHDVNVVIGTFGLYVVYLVCDWKNNALTHLGMKMLMKIKDDDSFEGDVPLKMLRKSLDLNVAMYEQMDEILEKYEERFEKNLKLHRIVITLKKWKDYRDGNSPDKSEADIRRSIELNMAFATAVYKHIFFLRDYIEQGKISRATTYQQKVDWLVRFTMQGQKLKTQFPDGMAVDIEEEIQELPEEDEEDDNKSNKSDLSRRQSIAGTQS